MWSAARSRGIPSEEFWGFTLREYSAIMERFRESEEAAFLRSGIISSVIANVNRDPKREAYTARDFMPFPDNATSRREPTEAEVLAEMRLLNAQLGGQDLTIG